MDLTNLNLMKNSKFGLNLSVSFQFSDEKKRRISSMQKMKNEL